MENLVKLLIDGKEVNAPAGMNLLDAGHLVGIYIPNLCYLKGMKGFGACRLCVVEVEGMKSPVIACNTKVRSGPDPLHPSPRLYDMHQGGNMQTPAICI